MIRIFSIVCLCLSLQIVAMGQSIKKLVERAEKQEAQEQHDEALETYKAVLKKKPSLVVYHEPLRRNAQKVLDVKLSLFHTAATNEQLANAVMAYDVADQFVLDLKVFNIDLSIPDSCQTRYRSLSETYVNKLYLEGKALANRGELWASREKFQIISKIQPNFRDIDVYLEKSNVKPDYDRAINHFDQKQYFKAWEFLEKVYQINSNYEKTRDYREKIIDIFSISMIVLPLSEQNIAGTTLQANLVKSIGDLKNPFLYTIEYNGAKLKEVGNVLLSSESTTEGDAAAIGRSVGAKYVLIATLVDSAYNLGQLKPRDQITYESYHQIDNDQRSGTVSYQTKYRPVNYVEYRQENELRCTYRYQLVSSETGVAVLSETLQKTLVDEILFAKYDGNYQKLHPFNRNRMPGTGAERDEFLTMFTARQKPLPQNELELKAGQELIQSIIQSLTGYLHKSQNPGIEQ